MSAPYEFSISRTRMIQLILCLVVIQILLYSSGIVTGLLMGPKLAAVPESLSAPVAQASNQQTSAQATKTQTAAEQAVAKKATPDTRQQPPPAPAIAPPVQATTAEPVIAQPAPADGVAVQVASFHTKNNADRLADLLKKHGYGPVLVGESATDGTEVWHFVQLGPYKQWDEASRIVAEVDRSYAVHAYVRPIRNSSN